MKLKLITFATLILLTACSTNPTDINKAIGFKSSYSPDLISETLKVIKAKPMECDAPTFNYPRWQGYPVTLCTYVSSNKTTNKTYMLNASNEKIAKWLITACNDALATNTSKCVKKLYSIMAEAASGNRYPVSGYVPEYSKKHKKTICYIFRDGITITTATSRPDNGNRWTLPKNKTCRPIPANEHINQHTQPVTFIGAYIRTASTNRTDYKNFGDGQPVGSYGYNDGAPWLKISRDLYQKAWYSDRNELISMVAKRLKNDSVIR